MPKQHKHCELIKAWADGAIVQTNIEKDWVDVVNPSWCESITYRIKPKFKMTDEHWFRVRREGFLTKNIHTGVYNKDVEIDCEVVREVGIRQPHFKGDKHPEGRALLIVIWTKSFNDDIDFIYAEDCDWDMVSEYIVIKEE